MKVQSTTDYNLFKRIKGNREVRKPHKNRLLEAIKDDPHSIVYTPIVVNENMEIIDGQHRFRAIKELALPVHYIQMPGLKLRNVQKLNSTSKAWQPMDYARSFAELGNKNYQTYIEFKDKYKLNHDILMRYLALSNPITGQAFNAGLFQVFNASISHTLCHQLLEVGQYYERYNIRNFALGYLQIALTPKYDHSRMLRQMDIHGDKYQEQPLPNDVARELERIYNYKQRESVRLF